MYYCCYNRVSLKYVGSCKDSDFITYVQGKYPYRKIKVVISHVIGAILCMYSLAGMNSVTWQGHAEYRKCHTR